MIAFSIRDPHQTLTIDYEATGYSFIVQSINYRRCLIYTAGAV